MIKPKYVAAPKTGKIKSKPMKMAYASAPKIKAKKK